MMADVVRGVGIETKVSMQEKEVRVVIELVTAEPALQTQRADGRFVRVQIQGGHVAGDFGNPVVEILRSTGNGCMCVLIPAVERQPVLRREFKIECHATTFNLTEILACE